MALTVTSRGTSVHNTSATSVTANGRSATFAVGSLGVLCMVLDNAGSQGSVKAAPDTATDSKGNVWTLRQSGIYDNGAASAGIEGAFYTAPITSSLATGDTLVLTWDAGVSVTAKAWTWYEVIPSVGSTAEYITGGFGTGATAANGQITTASVRVGDAVIAGYFAENANAVTGDSDSTNGSWTAQQTQTVGSSTSAVRIATQQKVQTTADSTQSYDVTVASQDRIVGYIMLGERTPVAASPTAASLTITGSAPTVAATDNITAAPTAAALALTPSTPTVTAPQTYAPTAASLVITGSAPAIALPVATAPTEASLVLTGSTPEVAAGQAQDTNVNPGAASLVLTGATPAISLPVAAMPTGASLALTGGTPAVAATDNILITPGPLGLVLTGAVPAIAGISSFGGMGGRFATALTVEPSDADEAWLYSGVI